MTDQERLIGIRERAERRPSDMMPTTEIEFLLQLLDEANATAETNAELASGWNVRWVAIKKFVQTYLGGCGHCGAASGVLDEIERLEHEPYPPKEVGPPVTPAKDR